MPNTEVNPINIDGFIHVVAAIIFHPIDKKQLLISRRQKGGHLAGYWELPGGKLETNETRLQALQRELTEELGITQVTSKPFMQVKHEYSDRKILLDVWMVTAFEGNAIGRENQVIKWITVNEIQDYQFPAADQPIIDAIKNNAIT